MKGGSSETTGAKQTQHSPTYAPHARKHARTQGNATGNAITHTTLTTADRASNVHARTLDPIDKPAAGRVSSPLAPALSHYPSFFYPAQDFSRGGGVAADTARPCSFWGRELSGTRHAEPHGGREPDTRVGEAQHPEKFQGLGEVRRGWVGGTRTCRGGGGGGD